MKVELMSVTPGAEFLIENAARTCYQSQMKDGVKVGFIGTVARHHELGTIALAVIKRNTPTDAALTIDGIPAVQEVG